MNLKRPHWLLLFSSLGCFVIGFFILVTMLPSDPEIVGDSVVPGDINSHPHWIFWAGCGMVSCISGVVGIIVFLFWMIIKALNPRLLFSSFSLGPMGQIKRVVFIIVAAIAVLMIVAACQLIVSSFRDRHHYPSSDFRTNAEALKDIRDYWTSHGRPANFRTAEVILPAEDFFIYTNEVRSTNGVFHCRFGSRNPGWPPGVLAVTDNGLVIFICGTNGKVTISPDEYGVDP